MISLQVNHRDHSGLQSYIVKKQLSETTQQTQDAHNTKSQFGAESLQNDRNATPKTEINDKESRFISNIRATDNKLKQDLQELINDYKDSAQKLMLNHGYDPERETAIRQHLQKLQKEKQQRRAKFQKDLGRLQAKRKALQELPEKNSLEKQQRKKSIEARIQHIHEREQRRREEEAKFIKFYEEYKSQKPKYKAMEEQFARKEKQAKEEKLKALKKKVEQTYKPMNMEELQEFKEEYENNLYQAQKIRLQNKLMEKKRLEANEAKLNELYKGHSHTIVIKQLQERQTKTDEPREKIKRVKEYAELVREQYRPRAMSNCDDTIDQDETSQVPQTERGKRVLKQRFLHGQYMGKKVQFEKTPLSHNQQLTKGMEYLQFLKKLPKKPKEKTQKTEASVATSQQKRTVGSVYRIARNRNPLYQGRRYNSIDFKADDLRNGDEVRLMLDVMHHKRDQMQLQQRVMKNKSFEDRDDFMRQQNRYNNNIYSSIKQKLAILSQL